MREILRLTLLAAACCCASQRVVAQELGQLPPAYAMATPGHVYLLPHPVPAAHGVSLPATTYAYGWFGVVPRCHHSRHYGYYNNYHQCAER